MPGFLRRGREYRVFDSCFAVFSHTHTPLIRHHSCPRPPHRKLFVMFLLHTGFLIFSRQLSSVYIIIHHLPDNHIIITIISMAQEQHQNIISSQERNERRDEKITRFQEGASPLSIYHQSYHHSELDTRRADPNHGSRLSAHLFLPGCR